jgi:hypothetical protein
MKSSDWTTPADVVAQLERRWERGQLLSVESAIAFPLALPLRRPDSRELSDRFDDVRAWIRALEDGSRDRRGFGYEIAWRVVDHRQLGPNRVPAGIVVPSRDDALRLIARRRHADRYDAMVTETAARVPELSSWIARRPLVALEHERAWASILDVVAWFRDQPRPGVYLRQVDVPGVDTKFIETRRGLFLELLDAALPPDAIDATAGRNLEARYGLLGKPALVRFRVLDDRLRVGGLSDIATPAAEFAAAPLAASRIFITENEINGLAFPQVRDAAVVFGLGYGVDRLAEVPWLREREVVYWGDLDTHGFAILDRLRAALPETRSLLMDRETLLAHRAMWVEEEAPSVATLTRLTAEEAALHDDLRQHRLGPRVRLEQERIGFGWVRRAVEAVARIPGP